MKKGGNDNRMDALISAVERNAVATEDMLKLAKEEQLVMQEPGPAICPHCGKLDPVITELQQQGEAGSGPLSEFVIAGETHCCNRVIYAVPVAFDCLPDLNLVADFLKMKGGSAHD